MLIIGLTGPSGAGKGVVADLFARYGLPVVDADRIYHELLVPPSHCLDALTERFGKSILLPNGTLNRTELGSIVFTDPTALEALNAIAHRFVMEQVDRKMKQLRQNGTRAAILDAPQLFEAGADRSCGVIVSVLADKKIRTERIMKRDGIGPEAALRRFAVQKSDEFFRTHSDYVIENNGAPEQLPAQVKTILQKTGVLPL